VQLQHEHPLNQRLYIAHAVHSARQRQPGPIHAARAVGEHGVNTEREQLIRRGLWRVLALELDAGLRVDEGSQFFALASLAATCSVMASTIAVATGRT